MGKAHKGMIGVYQLKNTVTGDTFIGASFSFGNSFKKEFSLLLEKLHSNELLQNIWNVHGPSTFEFSILESCDSKSMLRDMYGKWLSKSNSHALNSESSVQHSLSGYVSVSRDLKNEIHELGIGSYDATVNSLIDFYSNTSNHGNE